MAFNYNGIDLPYDKYSREGNAAQILTDYFSKTFGRAPTTDEISQFLPTYLGTDKNITDVGQGNAAVSRYHQQQNPNAQFEKDAPAQYDTVNGLFNQYLGRDATKEEKDHFATLLASKQYDAYAIGDMLKNLPENVRKQDEAYRQSLQGELQTGDARYFNEQIMPGISRNFAQSGRSFDSSAYAQALAQAAQGQNRDRESFLSNLSAQQYQGNKANAYQDYVNNLAYTRNKYDTIGQQNQQRLYELENYNMQKQAYDQYLSRYGKRSSGMGSGIGSLAGMGIGALMAPATGGLSVPIAMGLGGMAGGSAGGLFESFLGSGR